MLLTRDVHDCYNYYISMGDSRENLNGDICLNPDGKTIIFLTIIFITPVVTKLCFLIFIIERGREREHEWGRGRDSEGTEDLKRAPH